MKNQKTLLFLHSLVDHFTLPKKEMLFFSIACSLSTSILKPYGNSNQQYINMFCIIFRHQTGKTQMFLSNYQLKLVDQSKTHTGTPNCILYYFPCIFTLLLFHFELTDHLIGWQLHIFFSFLKRTMSALR